MDYRKKIFRATDLPVQLLATWRSQHLRLVFTNGCFDLLHRGHIQYLFQAAGLGQKLVIGLNSDQSVSRLKGIDRPIMDEESRAAVLASLMVVDLVILFEADTPYELIQQIEPDVLVKGGDWPVDKIVGSDVVLARGGEVLSLPYLEGESTSSIIERIKKQNYEN